MTSPHEPPLLFLDVDGTVVPFGGVAPPPAGSFAADDDPYVIRCDPALGLRLTALPCRLVWATAWMHDANDELAPLLGLPQLPVVVWPEQTAVDDLDERAGLHWKTRALVTWAAGRPFAWVDDELTDVDRAWVANRHPVPALLHHVDHARGLTDADFGVLDAWLREPGCGLGSAVLRGPGARDEVPGRLLRRPAAAESEHAGDVLGEVL